MIEQARLTKLNIKIKFNEEVCPAYRNCEGMHKL